MNRKVRASRGAIKLLDEHNLKERPINLTKLADKLNIAISEQSYPDDSNISAVLVKKGNYSLIGVNTNHPDTRQRFSIAHEIGHWYLHADGEQLDVAKGPMALSVFTRSESRDQYEIEANEFAAELLMPKDLIEKDFKELVKEEDENLISKLAKRYKVSESAITYRLINLGLVVD